MGVIKLPETKTSGKRYHRRIDIKVTRIMSCMFCLKGCEDECVSVCEHPWMGSRSELRKHIPPWRVRVGITMCVDLTCVCVCVCVCV